MRKSSITSISLEWLLILTCLALLNVAPAAAASKPRFITLPPRYWGNVTSPATSTITNWTGSLGNGGTSFTMVGTNPQNTNTTTTITAYLIPIKIVMVNAGGVFDPSHTLSNGRTVIQNTSLSPIFNAGIDFVQGGTDVGNTQYIDAF